MKKYNLDSDSHAIPFKAVKELLDYLPYGTDIRIMVLMLIYTGCRITELDAMQPDKIIQDFIFWKMGKTGKARKEKLPIEYIKELAIYRKKNKVNRLNLFGISSDTFRRAFNKFIRPNLSNIWQEKRLYDKQGTLQEEYILQLKGFRKNYQTLEFKKQLDKWKSSSVALEFASKKMKHSSKHITAYHYIENFEALEIDKYANLEINDIIKGHQTRLFEFF